MIGRLATPLARLVRPRTACAPAARRAMSGNTDRFDAIVTEAYNRIAENHRHPDGPWGLMTEEVMSVSGADGSPTVLDIASGPGEPALTIARAMPGATVICTDLAEEMVKAATANAAGVPNVTNELLDVEDMSTHADGSIDVVTCCYGFMFPEDKARALSETLRVLKPGGTLIATTWDSVDILKISKDVMTGVLGFAPPPPPLNPMSLSEPGLFAGMLADAGFVDVRQTTSTYPFMLGDDKDFQFTVGTILLREKLDEIGGDAWAKAEDAFWANIDKYTTTAENGEMCMPANTFRLSVAKKAA